MDLCVFYFLFKFFFIQMDHEAMSVLTILIFWNLIFIISIDMQTFAIVHSNFNKIKAPKTAKIR
jgi:hypothetical protein